MNKRDKKKKEKAVWLAKRKERRQEAEIQKVIARMPLQIVQQEPRECGGCKACCMAIAVHEIEKPMWQHCKHECEIGCGIYNERPQSCRDYWCMWQGGMLKGEENRPDRLGLIFDFRAEGDADAISVWEVWEGAADSPQAITLLKQMTAMLHKVVFIIRRYNSNKRRIIGPANLLSGLQITERN